MKIQDNDNNTIQSFQPEERELNVNELLNKSLDDEYENINFYKITIINISEVKLKNEILSFNIIGNLDSNITEDKQCEILLKDNNNKTVNATCNLIKTNILENQAISCNSKVLEESETLIPESGIYSLKDSNDKIIMSNSNSETNIDIPQKKGKNLGLIIGMSISGFVILCIALILIIKFSRNKKSNNVLQQNIQLNIPKQMTGPDNSRDIII